MIYILPLVQAFIITFSIWLLVCNNQAVSIMSNILHIVEMEHRPAFVRSFYDVTYYQVFFRLLIFRDWRKLYDPTLVEHYEAYLKRK